MNPVIIVLPLKTKNPTNGSQGTSRGAMFAAAKKRKAERGTTGLVVAAHLAGKGMKLPVKVLLTRIAPSTGLDDDNVRPAMKSVRDGVADAFGVSDKHPGLHWDYDQRRGKSYAVEIRLEPCA